MHCIFLYCNISEYAVAYLFIHLNISPAFLPNVHSILRREESHFLQVHTGGGIDACVWRDLLVTEPLEESKLARCLAHASLRRTQHCVILIFGF